MGFDLDAQRSGTITGFGMIESGYIDFSSGSQTLDVPTRMTKAIGGFGIAKTTNPEYQGLVASTDGDITTGNITFHRHSAYLGEDLRVHYILLGY